MRRLLEAGGPGGIRGRGAPAPGPGVCHGAAQARGRWGAEEVAQNVFAALARKAWQFAPDDSLPAWLYRTTLFEAKAGCAGSFDAGAASKPPPNWALL